MLGSSGLGPALLGPDALHGEVEPARVRSPVRGASLSPASAGRGAPPERPPRAVVKRRGERIYALTLFKFQPAASRWHGKWLAPTSETIDAQPDNNADGEKLTAVLDASHPCRTACRLTMPVLTAEMLPAG